ncbi:MAG TPA: ATPase, T2SS/T4P/T4SS family [Longimicrobium sp.]|nr:ATPase, T2SS/T4P/T4SS family [Longimicrobium sp.]
MPKIDQFLNLLVQHGGSDLHLSCGGPPVLRVHGHLQRVQFRDLVEADLNLLLGEIITPVQLERYQSTHDLDFAYEIKGVARFRGNFFRQHRGPGAVFRIIPSKIPSAEEINLPDVVRRFTDLNKKALVNQREVGPHTESFASALKAALREDPDVILVGEMRDRETISLALTAAETGHLVFGTLHTNSAHKTVDRIIDTFPGDLQHQVRAMLSESLRGVVAQQLLRKKDGKGRVAAHEIMVGTAAVSNLIREGKTYQIPSIIQTGKKDGMVQMDQSILAHLMAGLIDGKEAYAKALDKALFQQYAG